MKELFSESLFFPVLSGILFYLCGDFLRRKLKFSVLNPLLISVALTISLLLFLDIDYSVYSENARYLSYLLTPTTVCLAIPLYRQLSVLRKNPAAIIAGILSGTIAGLCFIFIACLFLGMSHRDFITLFPKSVTTAIGMSLSEELGGDAALTAGVIMVTGIFGSVAGSGILRLFRIKEPVAKGVAMGTAAHAIGTSRALEMGETEGAVSSLSLIVAGIFTVLVAPLFSGLL